MEVFEQALVDASARSRGAQLGLVIREARDLPASIFRAYQREMEGNMSESLALRGQDRITLAGLLAGLWLFIFLGPLIALVPYMPGRVSQLFGIGQPLWLAVVALSSLLGLGIGWAKGFPRWSYPYLVVVFFVVAAPAMAKLSLLVGALQVGRLPGVVILLASFLAMIAAFVLLIFLAPPLRRIIQDIRADWTRLSFGMSIYLAFATSFYGGDHLPPLTLLVVLPSLVVMFCASIYLLCRPRWVRILALAVMTVTPFVQLALGAPEELQFNWFAVFLLAIIFLPALVELLPRRTKPLAEG